MKKSQLDTPALLLDIERFERNLDTMRDFALSAHKRLRPHAKTHKCPEIARRQLARGNCAGVCAAKVSEAEKLVSGGVGEVLITSPVVTPEKIAAAVRLNRAAKELMLTVDHPEVARALSAAACADGKILNVLIDIDPEMGRTGVRFDEAVEFGKFVSALPFLKVRGIQCYCGQLQHVASAAERREKSVGYMRRAAEALRAFRTAGIGAEILTGTGTGTSFFDVEIPEVTDIQVGSYCLMDAEYSVIGTEHGSIGDVYAPALTLLSSVIGVNQSDFVTLDAGTKACYVTPGAPPLLFRDGKLRPEWRYDWSFGDEHGKLFFPAGEKPALGSKLEFAVSHCDPTVNLFDRFYVTRGDEVIDTWEISLRGCCR